MSSKIVSLYFLKLNSKSFLFILQIFIEVTRCSSYKFLSNFPHILQIWFKIVKKSFSNFSQIRLNITSKTLRIYQSKFERFFLEISPIKLHQFFYTEKFWRNTNFYIHRKPRSPDFHDRTKLQNGVAPRAWKPDTDGSITSVPRFPPTPRSAVISTTLCLGHHVRWPRLIFRHQILKLRSRHT